MTVDLLARVATAAGGRRLLALVTDDHAEKHRRRDRAGSIDGSLGTHVRLASDALVDVVHGREPRRWTVVADDPRLVGAELRRRIRGGVSSRYVQAAVHLTNQEDGYEVRVLDARFAGPLAEPVVTLRGATLALDGPQAGTLEGPGTEDLLTGRLRLADAAAFERRPEALVTLARLAVRPELHLEAATGAAARAAFADGRFQTARQSRLWFALVDLLDAPEAIEALELLRNLSAPRPLHESAEVDGALLRRAERLLAAGASRRQMLVLGVVRNAYRHRVRAFSRVGACFDGPEARAVIAAAGPGRRPRWA